MIGTFVWDTIHHPGSEGAPLEQWGGLAYSLSAFSAACPEGFVVVPIAKVGADLADAALALTRTLPNLIVSSSLVVVQEPNNRVELHYHDAAERSETLSGGVSPWRWEELEPHLEGIDALYINFLSGNEMEVGVAEKVSGHGIPVFADLHSLFLGPPGNRPRTPRRLPDWERWLGCFDAVQLNENELGLLGPERRDPLEMLPRIPEFGPSAAFVTRGAAGARYCVRDGGESPFDWPRLRKPRSSRAAGEAGTAALESVLLTDAPVTSATASGDPTGCGDIWGSVLFSSLCGGSDVAAAVGLAQRAAAAKIGERGIGGLRAAIARALAGPIP